MLGCNIFLIRVQLKSTWANVHFANLPLLFPTHIQITPTSTPPPVLLTDLITQRCVNTDERLKLIFQNARTVIYYSFHIFEILKWWDTTSFSPFTYNSSGGSSFFYCMSSCFDHRFRRVFIVFSPAFFCAIFLLLCSFVEQSSGSLLFAIRLKYRRGY